MIFIDNEYSQEYYKIIHTAQERAKTRKQAKLLLDCVERHHIIPKSFYASNRNPKNTGWILGCPDDPMNYAFLSAREHFRVHWLLAHMTLLDENNRNQAHKNMVYSLIKMSGKGNQIRYQVSEDEYHQSKQLLADYKRKEMTGSKRPPFSDEHRKKISLARTGTKRSLETCIRMSNNRTGKKKKPHSEDTKVKISKSNKGKTPSAETRKLWSEQRKGKSPANKGKTYKVTKYPKNRKSRGPLSPETIEKMRESRKEWHKRKRESINN